MRISLKQVALISSLLASALPLSAKDDVDQPHAPHPSSPEEKTNLPKESPALEKKEEGESSSIVDTTRVAAAEAVHDDALSTIPPLPAELLDLVNATPPALGESSDSSEDNEKKKAQHVEAVQSNNEGEQQEEEERQQRRNDNVIEVEKDDDEIISTANTTPREEENDATENQDDSTARDTSSRDGDANSDTSRSAADINIETKDDQPSSATSESSATTKEEIIRNKDNEEEIQRQSKESNDSSSPSTSQQDSTKKEEEEEEDGRKQRVQVDYANKAAGALILEKSSSMKGTSNLLLNDNDRYAIAPCSDKKYVIIGLSEDILVKTIKLSNYERYSSRPKKFQVLGSSDMVTFVDLGEFVAQSGNGEQEFELVEPAWVRYLKFRFLTHYGAEHYCTVSQIKVHGSTMTQGFQEQYYEEEEKQEEVLGDHDGEEIEGESSTLSVGDDAHVDDGNDKHVSSSSSDGDNSDAPDIKQHEEQTERDTIPETNQQQQKGEQKENVETVDVSSRDNKNEASSSKLSDPKALRAETGKDDSIPTGGEGKRNGDDGATTEYQNVSKSSSLSCHNDDNEGCNDKHPSTEEQDENSNTIMDDFEAAGETDNNGKREDATLNSSSTTATTTATKIPSARGTNSNEGHESETIPQEVEELAAIVKNHAIISDSIKTADNAGDENDVMPEERKQQQQKQTILSPSSPPEVVQNNNRELLSSSSAAAPSELTDAANTFDDDTETDVLLHASIGTSSSAKTSSLPEDEEEVDHEKKRTTPTVLMKDASYSVKNVVIAAVAEASGAIQTVRQSASSATVAGAVKRMQKIILTKVVDNDLSSQSGDGGTPDKTSEGDGDNNEVVTSGASTLTEKAVETIPRRHGEEASHSNNQESKSSATATVGVQDSVSQRKQQLQRTGSSKRPTTSNRGMDASSSNAKPAKSSESVASADSTPDLFTSLSRKFPSMTCLDGLDYQEFRTKIMSGRASGPVGGSGSSGAVAGAGGGAGGVGGGPPNKIEPIFKKLTDEIKSLQNTQSANEQYVGALQGCYQQIILDMAMHIEAVESVHEDRLAKLEGALRGLQEERNAHWVQQYASKLLSMGSEAREQAVPFLLAAIGWCYTFGMMVFLLVERSVSEVVSSLLEWLLQVVENDEIKMWLESVAAVDKGTARQSFLFCLLVFWLVLTQIRLCRAQRKTKRSISLGRGGGVKLVHLRDTNISDGVACPQNDGRTKLQQGHVPSHAMDDDMSYSDLSEGETPLAPIEDSPRA